MYTKSDFENSRMIFCTSDDYKGLFSDDPDVISG